MPEPTPVTREWLEAQGFKRDQILGYVRKIAEGPGDSMLGITVGNFPFNEVCCCVHVGGVTFSTGAQGTEDIDALIRLLDGATVDHPDEAWIDDDAEGE